MRLRGGYASWIWQTIWKNICTHHYYLKSKSMPKSKGGHPDCFVVQDYLGVHRNFYPPTEQGMEIKIKERLANWRKQFTEAADKNVAV
jgi:hypothetical protein